MLQIAGASLPAVKPRQRNYDANLKPLVTQLPLLSCEVCVIVPVRDEATNLTATLLALTNQIDLKSKPLDKNCYEIIVLANNCTDNSAEVVKNFARTHLNLNLHLVEMTLNEDRAHIGWVRKILMDEAYRRLKFIGREWGIIASTDGDTKVSSTWIAATLAEVKHGADAVSGRIITDANERNQLDKTTKLYYLRRVRYGYLTSQLEAYLDPDCDTFPRHHYHCGASFAVTARMYAKVGGLPPLSSSEDIALYNALMRIDARFRHSREVRVVTSARALGRAKAGLADRLAKLKIMGQQHQSILVESASLLEGRFHLRRHLRYLWQSIRQDATISPSFLIILARLLDLNKELLLAMASETPSFGLLVEQLEHQQNNRELYRKWQKVPIQQAISDLKATIACFSKPNCCLRNQQKFKFETYLDSLEQIEPIPLLPQSF